MSEHKGLDEKCSTPKGVGEDVCLHLKGLTELLTNLRPEYIGQVLLEDRESYTDKKIEKWKDMRLNWQKWFESVADDMERNLRRQEDIVAQSKANAIAANSVNKLLDGMINSKTLERMREFMIVSDELTRNLNNGVTVRFLVALLRKHGQVEVEVDDKRVKPPEDYSI